MTNSPKTPTSQTEATPKTNNQTPSQDPPKMPSPLTPSITTSLFASFGTPLLVLGAPLSYSSLDSHASHHLPSIAPRDDHDHPNTSPSDTSPIIITTPQDPNATMSELLGHAEGNPAPIVKVLNSPVIIGLVIFGVVAVLLLFIALLFWVIRKCV
ncbi:hypothetical protein F4808DRAFT_435787 [Astrocystis sublimbata]|nr:hypothetical protein F4808DRAFT_435787 [Astrocystis sublimbata]